MPWWAEVQLVPLVLAIGMSLHWPVIGWSYGRTTLFAAHAVVRAIVVFLIWWLVPDGRFTLSEVECLASCGTAPMMQVNDDYYENLTEEKINQLLDAMK